MQTCDFHIHIWHAYIKNPFQPSRTFLVDTLHKRQATSCKSLGAHNFSSTKHFLRLPSWWEFITNFVGLKFLFNFYHFQKNIFYSKVTFTWETKARLEIWETVCLYQKQKAHSETWDLDEWLLMLFTTCKQLEVVWLKWLSVIKHVGKKGASVPFALVQGGLDNWNNRWAAVSFIQQILCPKHV